MGHVVLVGDSIFDNGVYVPGEADVRAQLAEKMADWKVTLLAVDGDVCADVETQLLGLPDDATHLVVSAGGNDALSHMGILKTPAWTVAKVLTRLGKIRSRFHDSYSSMLEGVLARSLPTVICTIYNPCFDDPALQIQATTALTVFNDIIISLAIEKGLPLIDLREVCSEPGDFANPIEPSARGGEKITGVIKTVLLNHNFATENAVIYF